MIDLIINPHASRGKARKKAAKVVKILEEKNVEFTAHYTTRAKEAIEIAKKLSDEGATDIIALGGDGTVNEVLNGINPETVRLGIIPTGTGNDFVSAAKIPTDVKKAVDIILNGDAKSTDYMVCGGIRGINAIGTGIDVDVLKRYAKAKVFKGKIAYVFALISSLIHFQFYKFKVVKGEEKEDKTALIACVGNGFRIGGGIRMCPKAVIDDGLLDFVVVNELKKSHIPLAFIKLMKGKILEQDFTTMERVDHVEIEFDKPSTVQIDGELYENLDFDLSLIKGGVKVYRP